MNDNAIKILDDELKRAKIRLELVCRAHYDAYTTERFFRRELKEAQEKNEPKEVIERMSGNLERAIAITKEANAMIDEAEERRRIALQAIHDAREAINPLNKPFSQPHEKAQTN